MVAATLTAFVAGIGGFAFIPQQFFPASNRPEILVDLWLPEGTAIKETEAQAKRLEAIMLADKDISFVTTYVGEGAPRFYLPLDQQLRNPNFAQLLVMAKDLEHAIPSSTACATCSPKSSLARASRWIACSTARRWAGPCSSA